MDWKSIFLAFLIINTFKFSISASTAKYLGKDVVNPLNNVDTPPNNVVETQTKPTPEESSPDIAVDNQMSTNTTGDIDVYYGFTPTPLVIKLLGEDGKIYFYFANGGMDDLQGKFPQGPSLQLPHNQQFLPNQQTPGYSNSQFCIPDYFPVGYDKRCAPELVGFLSNIFNPFNQYPSINPFNTNQILSKPSPNYHPFNNIYNPNNIFNPNNLFNYYPLMTSQFDNKFPLLTPPFTNSLPFRNPSPMDISHSNFPFTHPFSIKPFQIKPPLNIPFNNGLPKVHSPIGYNFNGYPYNLKPFIPNPYFIKSLNEPSPIDEVYPSNRYYSNQYPINPNPYFIKSLNNEPPTPSHYPYIPSVGMQYNLPFQLFYDFLFNYLANLYPSGGNFRATDYPYPEIDVDYNSPEVQSVLAMYSNALRDSQLGSYKYGGFVPYWLVMDSYDLNGGVLQYSY